MKRIDPQTLASLAETASKVKPTAPKHDATGSKVTPPNPFMIEAWLLNQKADNGSNSTSDFERCTLEIDNVEANFAKVLMLATENLIPQIQEDSRKKINQSGGGVFVI